MELQLRLSRRACRCAETQFSDQHFGWPTHCYARSMTGSQCFVYLIRSRTDRSRYYTGVTSHVAARLAAHNAGRCTHTATATPWEIVVVVEFAEECRAIAFKST